MGSSRALVVVAVALTASGLAACKEKSVAGTFEEDAAVVVAPIPTVPPAAPPPQGGPVVVADPVVVGGASASASARSPSSVTLLEKANEAASEGRSADVRRLLEAKVRSGHGSPEEVRLVRKACAVPFDRACIDDIKSKYP